MIDAHRIVYNNLSSEEFDATLRISFDGDNGVTSSFLNRDGVYTEHYDGHRTIHRAKYNEAFMPRFTLIKKNFGDFDAIENRKILSWLTASGVPGWLEVYKDDSNVLEWRVFGCVTSIEQYKLGNGRIVGYEFEIEGSHPYAWSRKFTYPEVYATVGEVNNNDETNDYLEISGTESVAINCNSDEYSKPLFPKVTITFSDANIYFPVEEDPMNNSYIMMPNVLYSYNENLYVNINSGDDADKGKFVITDILSKNTNTNDFVNAGGAVDGHYYFPEEKTVKTIIYNGDTDIYEWKGVCIIGAAIVINNTYALNGQTVSKETKLSGGALGETIILDGTNKVIYSATSTDTKIIGDSFNWEWPSFITGENKITVTGNCKIKFEWIEPRKVGSL